MFKNFEKKKWNSHSAVLLKSRRGRLLHISISMRHFKINLRYILQEAQLNHYFASMC
jgi:hypothetical protein